MDIPEVLALIRPGEQWVLHGTDYSGLEWLCSTPKPTTADLEVGQALLDSLAYQEKRKAAYPSIGDQLEALWAGGPLAAEMKIKIQAVKDKYPKK